MRLRKNDVKELLNLTYPEYGGRKFFAVISKTYHLEDYWTDGTRRYAKFIKWQDNSWKVAENPFTNPFKSSAHQEFEIPEDVMIVENTIFCGHDLGIRFIMSPGSVYLPKFITDAIEKRS